MGKNKLHSGRKPVLHGKGTPFPKKAPKAPKGSPWGLKRKRRK